MKENSKTISGNSPSPHGGPEQGYPLLNGVRLHLWRRLLYGVFPGVLKGKNSLGPRDPKRIHCAEKWGLGTRQAKTGDRLRNTHLQRTNTKPPRHHSYTIDKKKLTVIEWGWVWCRELCRSRQSSFSQCVLIHLSLVHVLLPFYVLPTSCQLQYFSVKPVRQDPSRDNYRK